MASEENISRIAKILARATSSEPHEASAALHAAYKRMRRDQVGIRQLLSLPLDELYQEALVKLVSVVLEDQTDLSPAERRKAFENYMAMITARFSKRDHADHGSSAPPQKDESELQRAEEMRKQRERVNEENRREHEEQARRTAYNKAEAEKRENSQEASKKSYPNETSTQTPQPLIQSGQSDSRIIGVATLIVLCMLGWFFSVQRTSDLAVRTPETTKVPLASKQKIQDTVITTHSVAALNANLRSEPTPQSSVKTILKRGDSFALISKKASFLEIQLPNGDLGFIAQELVLPSKDLTRFLKLTAREYVEGRLPEKRIENTLLQTEKQKIAFVKVLYGLGNRSNSMDKYLEELVSTKELNIDADGSASLWYSLAASAAMKAEDYESTYWEARAGIEADPANADHHVAFALANYYLGNYETVKAIGRILPRLAPTSTNAWMMFAIGSIFDPEPDDEQTKAAFVLAIRLSRNAGNTRKYFQDFAIKTPVPRIREILNAALKEELNSPEVFASVVNLRTGRGAP
jgi:hypothetical protein